MTRDGATGFTPFKIVYGKPPLSLPSYILGTTNIEAIDSKLSLRAKILMILRNNLQSSRGYEKIS